LETEFYRKIISGWRQLRVHPVIICRSYTVFAIPKDEFLPNLEPSGRLRQGDLQVAAQAGVQIGVEMGIRTLSGETLM